MNNNTELLFFSSFFYPSNCFQIFKKHHFLYPKGFIDFLFEILLCIMPKRDKNHCAEVISTCIKPAVNINCVPCMKVIVKGHPVGLSGIFSL